MKALLVLVLFSIERGGERREIKEKVRKRKIKRGKETIVWIAKNTDDVKRRQKSWESMDTMDTMEGEGKRNRKEEQAKDREKRD